MTITSVSYLILIAVGAFVYYIVPQRRQWLVLLALSLLFYRFAGTPYTFIYILFSAAVMHLISNLITPAAAIKVTVKKLLLVAGILLCALPWFLFGAKGLWLPVFSRLLLIMPSLSDFFGLRFVAALGMGYYTCMSISYLVDSFWGNVTPQKNPLKSLLYLCFFPQLVAGPISRNEHMKSLFEGHTLSYRNVSFGAQRMLWGFMKKLILAERVAVITNTIWGDLATYGGIWHWVAVLVYPVYMYADFSGCMDIILGAAEIFGIRLPENFNNPFFSRSVEEFWRRWHITLGSFAKDYVMYPLLKSRPLTSLGKWLRKRFSKKSSKFIVSAIASAMVWLVMGAWHGAFRYIVGVSFFYWFMLELSEFIKLRQKERTAKSGMSKDSFGLHFFQSARTYIIYAIGAAFFAAPRTRAAFSFVASLFLPFSGDGAQVIGAADGILAMRLTAGDFALVLFMIVLMFVVAVLRERCGFARNFIAERPIALRWMIWAACFFILLIWGKYGENYDAAAFIYQGF